MNTSDTFMNRSSSIYLDPGRHLLGFASASALCAALLVSACGPSPTTPAAEFEARVSLLNKSREMHVLRVRELRPEVQLDCELVAEAPAKHLADDAFGPPTRWPLYSDQEIGLGPNSRNWWGGGDDLAGRDCSATLVQSDTVADIVVFWDRSLQPKRFAFDPDIPEYIKPDPQTIVLRADYGDVVESEMKPYRLRPCDEGLGCGDAAERVAAEIPDGARYFWESVFERPLHFEHPIQPDDRPQRVESACAMPGAEASLTWETAPAGEWEVLGLHEGIDGCHTLEIVHRASELERHYVVCAPIDSLQTLSPRPGATVLARFGSHSLPEPNVLRIQVRYTDEAERQIGNVDIYLTRGPRLQMTGDDNSTFDLRADCGPVQVECGQMELPVDVRIGDRPALRAGESIDLNDGSLVVHEVHLVRALRRSVVDGACAEDLTAQVLGGNPGHYIEAVQVIGD